MISQPLSDEARRKLLEFTEDYIETLMETEVNLLSDIAKVSAIELLKTDIDIMVLANTLSMFQHRGVVTILLLVQQKLKHKYSPELLAQVHYHEPSIGICLWSTSLAVALWGLTLWSAVKRDRREGY